MPEPEKKMTGEQVAAAMAEFAEKVGLFGQIMEQCPEIMQHLKDDEAVVLEMLGDTLVVTRYSDI